MKIIQNVARDPNQNFSLPSNLLASSLHYFLNIQFTKEQAQHKDNEVIANHLPSTSSFLFKYKGISKRIYFNVTHCQKHTYLLLCIYTHIFYKEVVWFWVFFFCPSHSVRWGKKNPIHFRKNTKPSLEINLLENAKS